MWQLILLFLVILIAIVWISRRVYHSRFSPVAVYFIIWIPLFVLYLLRLIEYHPIHSGTWFALSLSFLAFFVGGMTPMVAHLALRKERASTSRRQEFAEFVQRRRNQLQTAILLFSFIGFVAIFGELASLLGRYGSFGEILAHQGEIRSLFETNEIDFGLFEYLAMFPFAGAVLGGICLGVFSTRRIVAYLPLVAIVLFAIPITARLNILWGLLLCLNAFVLTRISLQKPILKVSRTRIFLLVILGLLLVLASNAMWQMRMGGEYPLYEEHASPGIVKVKRSLIGLTGDSAIGDLLFGSLISNYAYATSSFAKLNESLAAETGRTGSLSYGAYSFAAAGRTISKLGVSSGSEFSGQTEQLLTPVPAKPGTYLEQSYYDFGLLGPILIPYLLAFASSLLYLRILTRPGVTVLGVLCILYVAIESSWHSSLFIHTVPFAALLILLFTGVILDSRLLRTR